jgi:hypothetical protein
MFIWTFVLQKLPPKCWHKENGVHLTTTHGLSLLTLIAHISAFPASNRLMMNFNAVVQQSASMVQPGHLKEVAYYMDLAIINILQ